MALVLGIGSLFSTPAHDSPFSQLAFAVMLIGIFAGDPMWALVCAIGFAIGYRIRRRNPPPEPLAATAAPHHSQHSPPGSVRIIPAVSPNPRIRNFRRTAASVSIYSPGRMSGIEPVCGDTARRVRVSDRRVQ